VMNLHYIGNSLNKYIQGGRTKRRTKQDISPVRRSYIQNLIDKVDQMQYGWSIKGGLSPEAQKLRNKTLIVYVNSKAALLQKLMRSGIEIYQCL